MIILNDNFVKKIIDFRDFFVKKCKQNFNQFFFNRNIYFLIILSNNSDRKKLVGFRDIFCQKIKVEF